MSTHDLPVEHKHVRRHNLALVLRLLAAQGDRSRASLAATSGLTRATVSSLTAELIERGLVREVGPDTEQGFGRPATLLRLDGSKVVTVGVELNVGYIAVLGRDLGGGQVYDHRVVLTGKKSTDLASVVATIAEQITRAIGRLEDGDRRVAGVTVAVPGVIDTVREVVRIAPNLGWRDVRLLDALRKIIGSTVPLSIENEANLGALAELRTGSFSPTTNLVYVLAENGVGAGVIVGGALLRGGSGAAGEVGHTTVQPTEGLTCGCGSRGCWETLVGLAALARCLGRTESEVLLARRLGPEAKAAVVAEVAAEGDQQVISALHEFGRWVGVGLANLIDVLDPDAIILAGNFGILAPWIMSDVLAAVADNALPDSLQHCRIEVSTLGFSAAALGGAIHAAERLFADPTLVAA